MVHEFGRGTPGVALLRRTVWGPSGGDLTAGAEGCSTSKKASLPSCLVRGLRWPKDERSLDLTRVPSCGLASTKCKGGWASHTMALGFKSSLLVNQERGSLGSPIASLPSHSQSNQLQVYAESSRGGCRPQLLMGGASESPKVFTPGKCVNLARLQSLTVQPYFNLAASLLAVRALSPEVGAVLRVHVRLQ